jgi:hypothetical protein
MSDRIELRFHDFLAEGRDESKSHVFLEIAQPAANEIATHGYFFAIAELSGATPKTIQMVRAWIEFAIESYYKSVPTNVENHFEAILGQLNTQSSLYLKQHANEEINMAVAVVCNSSLYLAIHGHPAALLFYRKDDAWHSMNMVDPDSVDQPGQLFSNVVTGVMRVDDQFMLATPRVTEFFSADRLAKISETKSMTEVNDHMLRVLNDLSSEYSFAGVWLRLVRAFDETKEIMQQKIAGSGEQPRPEKKSDISMSDLLTKTKTTATILAPPVLTIPKDKIVTNILKLAQSAVITSGKTIANTAQKSATYIKEHKNAFGVNKLSDSISFKNIAGSTKSSITSRFTALPTKRRYSMFFAIGIFVIAIIAIASIALSRSLSSQRQSTIDALNVIREKVHAADESFVYQNESVAQTSLLEAEALYANLSDSIRSSSDGVALQADITEKHNKILHIKTVAVAAFDEKNVVTAKDIISTGTQLITLSENGDITSYKDGAKIIGSIPGAQKIYFDEQNKQVVAELANRKFKAITLDGKKTSDISVSWMSDDTQTSALMFYAGRLYAFNEAARAVFRYDGASNEYSSGKRWIVDNSKPTGVTALTIDNSVWMRTQDGRILKYTAGKAQSFKITGAVPEAARLEQVITSTSGNIYFLDKENHRLLQTSRDGKLITQFSYPESEKIKQFVIDKNETIATGLTDDARVVKITIGK